MIKLILNKVLKSVGSFTVTSNKKINQKKFNITESNIRKAFKKIKDELNEHRDSINQNTNEIQGNYESFCKIDSRVDKLSERIDELSLFIQQLTGTKSEYDNFIVSTLTTKEQEVFMAIYLCDNEISYKEIGRKTGLTENLVVCYVTNLITKGVSITKRYIDGEVRIGIEPEFKKIQTKQNILKINEGVSQSVMA